MSIWEDPEVQAARDLNHQGVRCRRAALMHCKDRSFGKMQRCDCRADTFFADARLCFRKFRDIRTRTRRVILVFKTLAAIIWSAVLLGLAIAAKVFSAT
jgi:hypothetical protein